MREFGKSFNQGAGAGCGFMWALVMIALVLFCLLPIGVLWGIGYQATHQPAPAPTAAPR